MLNKDGELTRPGITCDGAGDNEDAGTDGGTDPDKDELSQPEAAHEAIAPVVGGRSRQGPAAKRGGAEGGDERRGGGGGGADSCGWGSETTHFRGRRVKY